MLTGARDCLPELWRKSRVIVFDFDGVLADSEPFYRDSWNEALSPWGHTIPEEEYWLHWTSLGEGLEGEIERHSLEGVDRDVARARQEEVYEACCARGEIPLFQGVPRLLTRLSSPGEPGGRPFVIASNTPSHRIRLILEAAGIGLPEIVGGEGLRRKPSPDIFLRAASVMGVRPSECLVFEDAKKGVDAALAGGFPVVVVENRQNAGMDHEGFCVAGGIPHLLRVLDLLKGAE
jgi:beta-phosphoglucomutase-like phosphatase (HAD superfamily)